MLHDSVIETPRPLRVVIVGPANPYRGGIAHFAEHLATALDSRGHETTVFTFSRQYPEFLFPGTSQVVDESKRASEAPTARRTIDSINPLSWRRTGKQIAKLQPDVVVINYWLSFFAPAFRTIARLAQRSGCKVVIIAHNALGHEPRLGDSVLARYLFKASDNAIALSRNVKQDLEETVGIERPVSVVPHPTYDAFGPSLVRDEAKELLKIDVERKTLLFFGFIRKYKGLDILLEALPLIVSRLPEILLVVAGEFYESETEYREQVVRLGLDDHVRFDSEYIPDSSVPVYFSAADLVVQPYRSATQSGVAQIAFNYERPIVVTEVGGLSEVVPHGKAGYVVPPENPRALADAVTRFFEEDQSEAMSRAVRQEKTRYSWSGVCEVLEGIADE